MASEYSFDISAEVDFSEVQNAFNTVSKQIANRYDFKGKLATLEFKRSEKSVIIEGADDYVADQILMLFRQNLAKRGVDLNALDEVSKEPASGGGIRKKYTLKDTLSKDECKSIIKAIKEAKIKKVKATNMGETVRISSASKDELQNVQVMIKDLKLNCPLTFSNYR